VNGDKLWDCYQAGAASCDGSGWFRGDQQQLTKLENFLKFRAGELGIPNGGQLDLAALYFEPPRRLPTNIDRGHLIQAIEAWWNIPQRNRATRYAVKYGGNHYPVKLVIARANLFANGYCLNPASFSGGREANRFVIARGLEVVKLSN
jgi:hypothetical protein